MKQPVLDAKFSIEQKYLNEDQTAVSLEILTGVKLPDVFFDEVRDLVAGYVGYEQHNNDIGKGDVPLPVDYVDMSGLKITKEVPFSEVEIGQTFYALSFKESGSQEKTMVEFEKIDKGKGRRPGGKWKYFSEKNVVQIEVKP